MKEQTNAIDKINLNKKFIQDRNATIKATKDFLENPGEPISSLNLRNQIANDIIKGTLGSAIQKLEELRDVKTGISMHQVNQDGVPIIIRDARNATDPPVRGIEAFEIQFLNAIRAAGDIVEIEERPELKKQLVNLTQTFMKDFASNKEKSQATLSRLLKQEINELGTFLEDNGISDAYNKLNVAKDFQNFNDKHSNVVTISSIKDKNGKKHAVIEAEVALKSLTEQQKQEYQNILNGNNPPVWYTVMPEWEQQLCKKYAQKITDGNHVIPAQLRQIVGMKNAFEKTTAIYKTKKNGEKELKELYASKHAGTIASLSSDKELKKLKKKLFRWNLAKITLNPLKRKKIKERIKKITETRQSVTNKNAQQAQEWIGNKKLHTNTLNAGPKTGSSQDKAIVKQTTKVMVEIKGRETNTAFNAWRAFGGANDLTGAKATLKELASNLPRRPAFDKIRFHLLRGRTKRRGDAKDEVTLLKNFDKIDDQTAKILNNGIDLRCAIERADKWIRMGKHENASLAVSRNLNRLTSSISSLKRHHPLGMRELPQAEEVLRMCASGKDRTGLAEHDQSAQAIATELGMDVKEIDRQILKSGHTAQQAGGLSAGGGTLGCFGTKEENAMGMPTSRIKGLATIVEESASTNKIEKPKTKFGRIKRFLMSIPKLLVYKKYYSAQSPPTTPSVSSKDRKKGMFKID